MFGIGPLEFIIIGIIAVVFIGPDRLPDAMRKFGKLFVQVRRHANDVKSSLQEVIHDAERELELEKIRELQAKLQAANPTQMLEAVINPTTPPPHELGTPDSETYNYDDSHYEDGTYKHQNPGHMPLTPDPFAHLPIQSSQAAVPVPPSPASTAADHTSDEKTPAAPTNVPAAPKKDSAV